MEVGTLIALLAIGTLAAVLVFALRSKRKIDQRLDRPDSPKSTLASDKPSDGRPVDT